MLKITRLFPVVALASALSLAGCAATSQECTQRVLVGTGIGAAGGAGVGALAGWAIGGASSSMGAAWGAGAGAVVGGVAAGLTCDVPASPSYAAPQIQPAYMPQREK